jgi:hypothetical protein
MGNKKKKTLVRRNELLSTDEQRERWEKAAAEAGKEWGPWMREVADRAANETLP